MKWLPLCGSSLRGWEWASATSTPAFLWPPKHHSLEIFPEQSCKCSPCLCGLVVTGSSCLSMRFVTIQRGVRTVGACSISQPWCLHLPQLQKHSLIREAKFEIQISIGGSGLNFYLLLVYSTIQAGIA